MNTSIADTEEQNCARDSDYFVQELVAGSIRLSSWPFANGTGCRVSGGKINENSPHESHWMEGKFDSVSTACCAGDVVYIPFPERLHWRRHFFKILQTRKIAFRSIPLKCKTSAICMLGQIHCVQAISHMRKQACTQSNVRLGEQK